MRTGKVFLSIALLFVTGCVPSLHPLYGPNNKLVIDSRLDGTWINESGNESWDFHQADDSTYELLYAQDESAAHFVARLVILDGKLFMDTYPDEEIDNDFYKLHLVPAHVFGRVWIEGDSLKMNMLDGEWLDSMIDSEELTIAHEAIEEGTVLTASTDDLQKLVIKYADDPEAFSNVVALRRLF
jgi:hypothetical protein